jgi:RimJ/RimL family protein N-acetyltransferase
MANVLTGRHVQLIPVAATDIDRMLSLLHRPQVRQYLCDDTLLPREHVESCLSASLDPACATDFWRIATTAHDFAGIIGLQPPSVAVARLRPIGWRSRELSIALDPELWGRGLARDAIEVVADHALADGVTFALLGAVDEPNVRSRDLMTRCGFVELGRVAGPRHTLVVYERSV